MNRRTLYGEGRLYDWTQQLLAAAKEEINREAGDYLTRVAEADYLAHIKQKYTIDPLKMDLDNITCTSQERQVQYERGYRGPGKARIQAVTFHIPYTGDGQLLGLGSKPVQGLGNRRDSATRFIFV